MIAPYPAHRPRLARLMTTLVLFSLLASLGAGSQPAAAQTPVVPGGYGQEFSIITIPADAQIAELPARQDGNPRLDSALAQVAAAARQDAERSLGLGEALGLRRIGALLQVQVLVDPSFSPEVTGLVDAWEGEVTGAADQGRLLQAWVPPAALEDLAAHPAVQYIQRPAEAYPLDEPQAGLYTTEGLVAMNADDWHNAGILGTGVKIAVIDTGFQGYNGLRGSDLPNALVAKNFVDGENDGQVDGTTTHGTACAEIIYDLAPMASLYLIKIATNVDLQEAKNFAISQGVQVISTSLGFYNVTPGDGTGQFADMTQDARQAGILWTTAAGNDRDAHWGGTFNPLNPPSQETDHQFISGQIIDYFGPPDQPGTAYQIQPGYVVRVYLRWDDWTAVNQDYDLYIVHYKNNTWNVVAHSTNIQNGIPGQAPTEFAQYTVPADGAGAYGFRVRRYLSTRNVNLEAFAPKVASLTFQVEERSLANLADAPDAMTVSAEDVLTFQQEPYSSEGPTNGPGGTANGGFIKPDIAAYANVSTRITLTSPAPYKFNGTSAAAPHVAGAAALVKSAFPAYTPDQVQDFLEDRSIDQGASGMDTVFGWGRLHLGAPAASKVWTGALTSDWHTAGNWNPSGAPAGTDDVYIPNVARDPLLSSANGTVRNLTIENGARLNLSTRTLQVEGAVSNFGEISQQKSVTQGNSTSFVTLKNAAENKTAYSGVIVQPTAVLTTTTPVTVTVAGNAFCSGLSAGVLRCFDIQVAQPITATLTLYFTEGERNGETLTELLAFHKQGASGWLQEPGPYIRGGAGDTQYVTVQKVDQFSPFALRRSGASTLRLPVTSKDFVMPPQPPVIKTINNADGNGSYTVSWDPGMYATSYTLQEDDNVLFASPVNVYAGSATSWNASGKPPGTYYYRVRSSNSAGNSAWSAIVSTQVVVTSGIAPGFWLGTDVEFYVTTNQRYVDDFAIFVYIGAPCNNTYRIKHTTAAEIGSDSRFSFSGAFYASGKFENSVYATGSTGLDNMYISQCDTYVSGGPWPWTASWEDYSQPSVVFEVEPQVMPAERETGWVAAPR